MEIILRLDLVDYGRHYLVDLAAYAVVSLAYEIDPVLPEELPGGFFLC